VFPVQKAQGTVTGNSVSEVAHGEQVNIRDRPGLVDLGAWKSKAYGMGIRRRTERRAKEI
jgi:hypothetical protein